jgi:hypothetical protein
MGVGSFLLPRVTVGFVEKNRGCGVQALEPFEVCVLYFLAPDGLQSTGYKSYPKPATARVTARKLLNRKEHRRRGKGIRKQKPCSISVLQVGGSRVPENSYRHSG